MKKILLFLLSMFIFLGCGGSSKSDTKPQDTEDEKIVPLTIPNASLNPAFQNKE